MENSDCSQKIQKHSNFIENDDNMNSNSAKIFNQSNELSIYCSLYTNLLLIIQITLNIIQLRKCLYLRTSLRN